jgi:hypothetical protein
MRKKKSKYTAREYQDLFGKKGGKIVNKTEEMEQAELIEGIKNDYPHILYTVDLGGVYLTPKQRGIHKTRSKRGHPDLMFQEWFLNLFCGLAIEFKPIGTKLTMKIILDNNHLSEQWEYIKSLRERGHIAGFCSGKYCARKVLDAYLEANEKSLDIINHYLFPPMNFKNINIKNDKK